MVVCIARSCDARPLCNWNSSSCFRRKRNRCTKRVYIYTHDTAYAVTSVSVARLERSGWNDAFERCDYEACGVGRTRSPRFKVSWSRVSRLIVSRNAFRFPPRERERERSLHPSSTEIFSPSFHLEMETAFKISKSLSPFDSSIFEISPSTILDDPRDSRNRASSPRPR